MSTHHDRRRAPRLQRLVTLEMQHDGVRAHLVTTDVSLYGAYVHAPRGFRLPIGFDAEVEYRARHDSPLIRIQAHIVRSVGQAATRGGVPGMALAFVRFSSDAGSGPVTDFVQNVLGHRLSAADVPRIHVRPDGSCTFDVLDGTPSGTERPILRVVDHPVAYHAHRGQAQRALPDDAASGERLLQHLATDVERRRTRRLPCRVEVTWYRGEDPVPFAGVVTSISARGFFLQTDHALPRLGERLRVLFPAGIGDGGLPGPPHVRLEATVRRRWDPATEGLPGVGLRLDAVDEGGRSGLFRLFLRRLEAPRSARRRRGFHYRRR